MERNPFPAKNQTLKILQSIYFAYEVGIIGSYSNRTMRALNNNLIHMASLNTVQTSRKNAINPPVNSIERPVSNNQYVGWKMLWRSPRRHLVAQVNRNIGVGILVQTNVFLCASFSNIITFVEIAQVFTLEHQKRERESLSRC